MTPVLKKARVVVSIASCVLLTFYFIDFTEASPRSLGWLAKMQLLPAILSGSAVIIVVAWLLLTLVAGRIYCSSICPMGIFQDLTGWISKRIGKLKRYHYRPPRTRLRWIA